MTVEAFLRQARERLTTQSETPSLDAQMVLAHVLGAPRSWVLAHAEAAMQEQQAREAERLLARLEAGVPLPYLIGHWEFYGLDFSLTTDVLIPRPETELLVEHALAWLQRNPQRRRVADVGTGSGCIAISLAVHAPDIHILATDISTAALSVARGNAARHGTSEQITFTQVDLLPDGAGPFDLICANLPYIPTGVLAELPVYRHEPSLALDGGADGLDTIRRLIAIASRHLAPGGALMLEIEAGQGAAAAALARAAFPTGQVQVIPDLAGKDRLLLIKPVEISSGQNNLSKG